MVLSVRETVASHCDELYDNGLSNPLAANCTLVNRKSAIGFCKRAF